MALRREGLPGRGFVHIYQAPTIMREPIIKPSELNEPMEGTRFPVIKEDKKKKKSPESIKDIIEYGKYKPQQVADYFKEYANKLIEEDESDSEE